LTFNHVEPFLLLAERRIYHTLYGGEEKLSSKEELLEILYEARKGIIEHHEGLFLELLDGFILKIKIFGFHFASMDVRQDSRQHDELWEGIVAHQEGEEGLQTFRKMEELELIDKVLYVAHVPNAESKEEQHHVEMLKSNSSIQYNHEKNGEMRCHLYIIYNAHSDIHLMKLYLLPKAQ